MSATATAWVGGALLLFASMYLGTGWSLVLFQLPGAADSTPRERFPERFGAPVRRAVGFFSVWSLLMVAGSLLLTITEWDEGGYKWGPLVYLVASVGATAFTVVFILPVNRLLEQDIDDEARFRGLLVRWIRLNVVRTLIWTVEWFAMALWFVALARSARS